MKKKDIKDAIALNVVLIQVVLIVFKIYTHAEISWVYVLIPLIAAISFAVCFFIYAFLSVLVAGRR